MPCSRPEFPQAAAYFSSPNNPDLHSIFVPIRARSDGVLPW
jgi:hypothetical protein